MNSSEPKNPGSLNGLKTALSDKEWADVQYVWRAVRQEAQRLCTQLNSWGVKASIKGEEGTPAFVEVTGSPIHWIHLSYVHDYSQDFSRYYYVYDFIVPDSRNLPKLEISAVRIRKWGFITGGYGKLIDIRWKGNDHGTGINQDQEIKAKIMSLVNKLGRPKEDDHRQEFVRILTDTDIRLSHIPVQIIPLNCWVIKPAEPYFHLTQDHWLTFEIIAKHLLTVTLPNQSSI